MLLPAGLTYNENREKTISVENVINLQPEVTFGGRQPISFVTSPGMKEFSTGNTVDGPLGREAQSERGVL